MSVYQNLPSDEDTIRLLVLQPIQDSEDEIECKAKLSNEPRYEALSYTWGDALPVRDILVYNHAVSIRVNLHDCSLRIRHRRNVRTLYVDALCVNHEHGHEKGYQAKLMLLMYNHADRVLAWLGEPTDESDALLTYANTEWDWQ
jgi:hypothetical protein